MNTVAASSSRLVLPALLAVLLLIAPEVALAESAPGQGVVDWLIDLFTGDMGRGLAILAIIVLGLFWMFGQLRGSTALGVIGGIVLIFGSATLADIVIGSL
jgi:type IV secretion system protein VirB2